MLMDVFAFQPTTRYRRKTDLIWLRSQRSNLDTGHPFKIAKTHIVPRGKRHTSVLQTVLQYFTVTSVLRAYFEVPKYAVSSLVALHVNLCFFIFRTITYKDGVEH